MLASALRDKCSSLPPGHVVICPDFLALREVGSIISGSGIDLGAQDVFWKGYGAYTGEVCAQALSDAGCRYIIIGHSERRECAGVNDRIVNQQLHAVLANTEIIPIVCIGENWPERESGKALEVIERQMTDALEGVVLLPVTKICIAYEPVWSISTSSSGKVINPADAQEMHLFIKDKLISMFGEIAYRDNFRIIYGGSVNPKNIAGFSVMSETDGFLVGGASLSLDDFTAVIESVLNN